MPDNAVSVNEGTEDRPICRRNARIGLIKNDKCHSVKAGGSFDKKEIDDGYQILVDTYNVYDAVQAGTDMYTQTDLDDATEDMYTQAEYDAATDGMYTQAEYDAAAEDMFTQTDVDDAVAEATEDMYTQTEYDAATEDMYTQAEYDAEVTATAKLQAAYDALIEAGDDAVYTQYEYEDAVWNTLSYTWTLSRGSDCHDKYRYNCDGITEYMEGICSGDVIFENTFNVAVCEQD
jgi:hypothetical protein